MLLAFRDLKELVFEVIWVSKDPDLVWGSEHPDQNRVTCHVLEVVKRLETMGADVEGFNMPEMSITFAQLRPVNCEGLT